MTDHPKDNMKVTKSENIIYCDVDETLCFTESESKATLEIDYYGQNRFIRPHTRNVNFLKSLHKRGFHIIVHSHNGWRWALNVIVALNLQNYVDEVKSKSVWYIDDKPVEEWFGPRVFLQE